LAVCKVKNRFADDFSGLLAQSATNRWAEQTQTKNIRAEERKNTR
jgi:hypothetical protein